MQEQKVYFEKQSYFSLQCGLYSVNNLLGQKIYTESSMKAICYDLSEQFINPHKHIFGGDYDVNVLMVALSLRGFSTEWFDKRQLPFKLQNQQKGKQLIGMLINLHSDTSGVVHKIFKISRRHWLAVRKIKDTFYWIDSKSECPKEFKVIDLQALLNQMMDTSNNQQSPHILLVYKQDKQLRI